MKKIVCFSKKKIDCFEILSLQNGEMVEKRLRMKIIILTYTIHVKSL